PALALLIVLVAALPGPLRSQPSIATVLWDQLHAIAWSTPYRRWQLQYRQAACDGFVRPPDEVIDGAGGADMGGQRRRQDSTPRRREWFLYAFNLRSPGVERLEQVRVSVNNLPAEQLETAARELSTLISNSYGAPVSERISEFGSAFWRQTARWRA